jgi:hypothetical protein
MSVPVAAHDHRFGAPAATCGRLCTDSAIMMRGMIGPNGDYWVQDFGS